MAPTDDEFEGTIFLRPSFLWLGLRTRSAIPGRAAGAGTSGRDPVDSAALTCPRRQASHGGVSGYTSLPRPTRWSASSTAGRCRGPSINERDVCRRYAGGVPARRLGRQHPPGGRTRPAVRAPKSPRCAARTGTGPRPPQGKEVCAPLLPEPIHSGPVLAEWSFVPCSQLGAMCRDYLARLDNICFLPARCLGTRRRVSRCLGGRSAERYLRQTVH